MATTIQRNPVLLQQTTEDEDVALATFISKSLRFDQNQDIWNYPQQQNHSRPHKPRSRVSSNSSQPKNLQKSTSTPINNNTTTTTTTTRHHNGRTSSSSRSYITSNPPLSSSESSNTRRKSVHSVMAMQDRRPSFTGSVTSSVSTKSDMSVSSKLSLSKKLRKVFSMNNLRGSTDLASLAERNGSSSSVASSVAIPSQKSPMSFRRRSIASLSNLFQKDKDVSPQPTQSTPAPKKSSRRHSSGDLRHLAKEDHKKRPELRVDTSESTSHTRKGLKVRSTSNNSSVAPDSPNSAISSRSFSRLPPPMQQRHFIQEPGLPSPTPSHDDDKHSLGLHYGIGLHGSPRLKPAASSTSSLVTTERRIQFCSTIQIHETFAAGDYDRRCDNNATCQKLTPIVAMKIKQELNEYKLSEMEVHVESRQYTHFFL